MYSGFLAKCSFLEDFFKNYTEGKRKEKVEIERKLASFENAGTRSTKQLI